METIIIRQGYRPAGPLVPPLPAPVDLSARPYNAADEDDYFDADADASYSFGFRSDEHERDETADQQGNIVGSYSYVDEAGITRTVSYKAGAGLGFVPQADFLPDELAASFKYYMHRHP